MGLYDWFKKQSEGTLFDSPDAAKAMVAASSATTNPIGTLLNGGRSPIQTTNEAVAAKAVENAPAVPAYNPNDSLNKGDADARNASWAKTLPSHLKPKIEKDKDGNEIVTIQGSLLNKMMKDMYSAGEENYQLENMPEPANAGTPAYENQEDYLRAVANDEKRQQLQGQIDQRNRANPYNQNPVVMQDQTTPQAEVLMRELMKSYPGRTPDEIARILRGGK